MDVSLVGLQHYNGSVTKGENVVLVRQKSNPYDSNAICVQNIINDQVGFISRGEAAALAGLIDKSQLKLEGIFPSNKGTYKMTLRLYCFAKPSDKSTVIKTLQKFHMSIQDKKLPKTAEKNNKVKKKNKNLIYFIFKFKINKQKLIRLKDLQHHKQKLI